MGVHRATRRHVPEMQISVLRGEFAFVDRTKRLSNVQIRSEIEKLEAVIDAFFEQKQRARFGEVHIQAFANRQGVLGQRWSL